MARFVYRLQKVYEIRERKLKEQEQRVVAAQNKVRAIEAKIEEKQNEIRLLRQNMLTSHHTLLSAHDEYIHYQNHLLDELYEDLSYAKEELAQEKKLLVKAQADFDALIKHKEKAREIWLEEEKQKEMKQLDEVASQRYFRNKQDQLDDEAEEERVYAEQQADLEAFYEAQRMTQKQDD